MCVSVTKIGGVNATENKPSVTTIDLAVGGYPPVCSLFLSCAGIEPALKLSLFRLSILFGWVIVTREGIA